jgi:hydrogenase maturation protease
VYGLRLSHVRRLGSRDRDSEGAVTTAVYATQGTERPPAQTIDGPRAALVVVGIGSVLLGDDGFGPSVVELVRAGWKIPDDVELLDAGTPGLDLAGHLHEREKVVLIDAVAAEGDPGDICCYQGEELRNLPMKPRVSPHDPALAEALWLVELAGTGPREVLLIGAIPATSEIGTGLSQRVRAAADRVASMVAEEIERFTGRPLERQDCEALLAWWLRDE